MFHMNNLLKIIAILTFVCLLATSCSREEGCLNPGAVNYNPGADKDCCCELASLRLRTYSMLDTVGFTVDQQLTDAGGNTFYIQDFKVYTTKLSLIDQAGNKTTVRDTTTFILKDNSNLDTADRYLLIDESVLEYNAGIFDRLADYDSLELNLGLDELANQINFDSLEEAHPLKNDLMYKESVDSLVSLRLRVRVNGSFSEIYEAYELQNVVIPYTIRPEIAFDTWVELDIDYKILLQNIDFLNDNSNTITSKLVINLPQAIRQHSI